MHFPEGPGRKRQAISGPTWILCEFTQTFESPHYGFPLFQVKRGFVTGGSRGREIWAPLSDSGNHRPYRTRGGGAESVFSVTGSKDTDVPLTGPIDDSCAFQIHLWKSLETPSWKSFLFLFFPCSLVSRVCFLMSCTQGTLFPSSPPVLQVPEHQKSRHSPCFIFSLNKIPLTLPQVTGSIGERKSAVSSLDFPGSVKTNRLG